MEDGDGARVEWFWEEANVLKAWVRIPVAYTGWAFFTSICSKNCNVCLKKTKNK